MVGMKNLGLNPSHNHNKKVIFGIRETVQRAIEGFVGGTLGLIPRFACPRQVLWESSKHYARSSPEHHSVWSKNKSKIQNPE